MRRAIFQIHLWVGVLAGVYIFIVSLTGAALVFRIDMQRALYPDLFTPRARGPLADPVTVMESVSRAYSDHKLSGVDAPTSARPTYLAYVTRGTDFLTVLIDPVSAEVLGELPDRTAIRALQDLHFNLMLGRSGRAINGIGAACTLVMVVTGAWLWWTSRRNWRRAAWELHRTAGVWSAVFIAMWAMTGLSFGFPREFRSAVSVLSPISMGRAPQSPAPETSDTRARPSWREQIATARGLAPGRPVARVVLPFDDRSAFLVMFATASPTPAGSALSAVYLDQFTGQILEAPQAAPSAGDRIMSWLVPIHVGDFGSRGLKALWFIMGLAPPVLCVTGLTIWWTRVVRQRLIR